MSKTRGLFEIHAISKDDDKIVYNEKVVAESEKDALFESTLKENLKSEGLKKSDVHLIVVELGEVPPKEDVKKVKIVGQVGKTVLGREE